MVWRWIILITLRLLFPFSAGGNRFVYLKLHHRGPGVGPDDFIDSEQGRGENRDKALRNPTNFSSYQRPETVLAYLASSTGAY